MASAAAPQRLSDAIVGFSLDGRFPTDIDDFPPVSSTQLQPAIDALAKCGKELEAEIHVINNETRQDVSSWVNKAKTLQQDMIKSKSMANEIIRQAEARDVSGEEIEEAETKADFLNREVQYSQQLLSSLQRIRHITRLLDQVDKAKAQRRILEALRHLEETWAALDLVGVSKSCRVMRLLNLRSFELKSDVHQVLDHVWKALIQIDVEAGKVSIYDARPGETMSLDDAVTGLKAYKEVDERMEQLWRNLDAAVVSPRMDKSKSAIPGIRVAGNELELHGQADMSLESLIWDLEQIFVFLAQKLPADLVQALSGLVMGEAVPKLIDKWLDEAVPRSLTDMTEFQSVVQRTSELCACLQGNGYTGLDELKDWANKAPTMWLDKYRENALGTVRERLAKGMGSSKQVEKVEKHMVSYAEGKELSTTGAGAAADSNDWGDDWGDAWGENDQQDDGVDNASGIRESNVTGPEAGDAGDDGAEAWNWDDGEAAAGTDDAVHSEAPVDDEDDSAAAWGWDDNDTVEEPTVKAKDKTRSDSNRTKREERRELVLTETYHISGMPEALLQLIFSILEDGAVLTQGSEEYSLVAPTAPGLFSLPSLILALFRAVSPYYYSLEIGGNMFLYNDGVYMAEKLGEFAEKWKQRSDLTARAKAMLRLDNEVKTLERFANRSYSHEMSLQKTVLQDLLGDSQSLMQQDEMESAVEAGTTRIRTVAATWESILARSVWSQAVGSLADALAKRLIADVLDMASIGQDDAYAIAKLISSATEIDDLFLPSRLSGTDKAAEDEVPVTAQYAPNWLRLKYLGEVLQSNLNEVKYLWCESELSLYFTVEEVVDLINASFEDNARTRETIRTIETTIRTIETTIRPM
ncbi:hypothetical protein CDD82_3270 [Ophiocordyceps australis]|uniref:ZW10 C-terminal helical domain-containing protein n=1 Tax=Ophiocordyceps australis TaxID=1399860 RepID=A0A2C5ZDP0_9HYPO|nr:hypothetical protein CDD82_3270 [Ophiocordyceps australis]